jgi:hypothetical protein
MFRILGYFSSFFTACLLAMPAGWCCIVPGLAASEPCAMHAPATPTKPAKATRSCCEQPQSEQTPATPQAPAPAKTSACCCQSLEAPVPEAVKVVVDMQLVCLLPAILVIDDAACFEVAGAVIDLPPPTPSVQILNCVWLC